MTRLFIVPPGAFRPAPKVDSAVARLVPLGDAKPAIRRSPRCSRALSPRRSGSGARRCAMRWRRLCGRGRAAAAGIDPGARGETLAVADFVRLAERAARVRGAAVAPAGDPAADAAPSMRTIFRRDVSPRSSVTLRSGTPNASARKRSSSAFALPSTGGAARRILSASPCAPATSVRFAPAARAASARARAPSSRRHGRSGMRHRGSERVQRRVLEPRHRQISSELRSTITISGERSSVPPSGGMTRRIGRRKRNVSALSSPDERPVGRDPRQDRLREHDDDQQPQRGLQELDQRERARASRRRSRRRSPPPTTSKRSASEPQRTARARRATSVDQSMPRHPGSTRRSGFTAQSVSAVDRLPQRIAERARAATASRSAAGTRR